MKYTIRYLKARRQIHIIDKHLNELERRLMRTRKFRMA